MAPSNDTVDRLNERCQQLRVQAGELDPYGPAAQAADGPVLAGDEIATRRNDRRLRTDRGEMVRNRATWIIDTIHHDGSITATGSHGTIHLPAGYVRDHVELAYATTAMGAQGRTVDHAILYLDTPADVRNVYVPMSRGRHSNHAYVATAGEDTAIDITTPPTPDKPNSQPCPTSAPMRGWRRAFMLLPTIRSKPGPQSVSTSGNPANACGGRRSLERDTEAR